MTEQAADPRPHWAVSSAPVIYGVTVFASAALIFLVEPMMAKMVLPKLGGSPEVWNTSMAFFQAALLIGYLYAHLLQRVKSLKTQVLIHGAVVLVSALVLPLKVSAIMGGQPGPESSPALWLIGVLALSLGPPFAALSATAPLAQAWYARVRSGPSDAVNPYVLYAASNLGSLIALLAYPTLVEPIFTLHLQTMSWSIGYVLFAVIMILAAFTAAKYGAATPLAQVVEQETLTKSITWKDRLIWIGLAAAPSSLMLGVTTHITMDVASTPFLWVAPLALYLLTFIFAFSSRPPIGSYYTLMFPAALAIFVAYTFSTLNMGLLVPVMFHLLAFFFTALMCHTALADRRPHPSRLTEFYLMLSIGGVVGGAFNAFLAPVVFIQGVWEYPIILVLACLARPWGPDEFKRWEWVTIGLSTTAFILCLGLVVFGASLPSWLFQAWHFGIPIGPFAVPWLGVIGPFSITVDKVLLIIAAVSIFLIRDRGLIFAVLLGAMVVTPKLLAGQEDTVVQDRSFFGILRVTQHPVAGFSQNVHILAHGTTLHGAQAREPSAACTPLTYYAHTTPIGQVFDLRQTELPSVNIGAVGMGAGTVASYVRATDTLRFFEIDQHVIDLSTNPENFTYINGCAKGRIDWVLGDARLSLDKQAENSFDILLVDAFSSDAVPAHLLTVEAMRMYLTRIKPDGVVIMHLSNRHLDLAPAVAAVAKAAGGYALYQYYSPKPDAPEFTDTGEEAIIVGRNGAALTDFAAKTDRWSPAEVKGARPWTDDYSNLFGALVRGTAEQSGPAAAVAQWMLGPKAR